MESLEFFKGDVKHQHNADVDEKHCRDRADYYMKYGNLYNYHDNSSRFYPELLDV